MPMPFANLGPHVLAQFGRAAAITVERPTAGTFSADGYFAPGAGTLTLAMDAAVMPARAEEMEALPENERTREGILIFTLEALRVSSVSARTQADIVTWAGRKWVVASVEDWTAQAGYASAIALGIE